MRSILILAAVTAIVSSALADEPIALTLQNHKFTPNIIRVKANQPALISMSNKDTTAEEFDSSSLKVEKVVAGHSTGSIRLRPLKPGKYPFMGEYHSDLAQGFVIAE